MLADMTTFVRRHIVPPWFSARQRMGRSARPGRDARQLSRRDRPGPGRCRTQHRRPDRSGAPRHRLAEETEYALITANLISRSTAIPVALLEALTRSGTWDHTQALAHAMRPMNP